jgi:uncharacterized protein
MREPTRGGEDLGRPATATAEHFTVMAKPAGSRCNLACGYCYYSGGVQADQTGANPRSLRMTDAMLERFIRQYIEASPGPVVRFTWHGGEPTLAGLDFYRLAVELQAKHLPQGWSCWNNLQTNGILLDDEWCAFLASARFDVGLSIDGARWLHDENRKDHSGGGTYVRTVSALRRLQAHDVQPDLLCTVTAAAAKEPLAVYQALSNFDTGWIQFIPIVRRDADGRPTADSVAGEDYGDFLCAVFDEWICRDFHRLAVQLFAETALIWSGGSAGLCWLAPTCGRVLVVEQDGGVYSCDHFVTPEHRLGDIESSDLGALADSPAQRRFGNDKRDRLTAQCRSCAWLAVCNGGCPKDRHAFAEDGEPGQNCLCAGLRRFFAHAEQPLKRAIQLGEQGQSPAAVMAALRAESLARWRNIGRNDPCPCGSGRKAKHCCWQRRP